jgi:hypothetical protein
MKAGEGKVAKLIEAAALIASDPPERAEYLHAVLCQVGLPRRRQDARTFDRTSGAASLAIEAGRLWNGRRWIEQPLPYGTRPRLVLVHVTGEAVRTRSPVVEVGHSIRGFMRELGADPGGRELARFKAQMLALAACRMTLGTLSRAGNPVTIDAKPIRSFEAWLHPTGEQRTLWPGTLELSAEFFATAAAHAVPLDPRALAALKGSALALDLYTWLAHRLCRVRRREGVKVTWQNLREQFGQEYSDPKNFRHEAVRAIRSALAVYPHAKVEQVDGGLLLRPSSPPIRRTITIG